MRHLSGPRMQPWSLGYRCSPPDSRTRAEASQMTSKGLHCQDRRRGHLREEADDQFLGSLIDAPLMKSRRLTRKVSLQKVFQDSHSQRNSRRLRSTCGRHFTDLILEIENYLNFDVEVMFRDGTTRTGQLCLDRFMDEAARPAPNRRHDRRFPDMAGCCRCRGRRAEVRSARGSTRCRSDLDHPQCQGH